MDPTDFTKQPEELNPGISDLPLPAPIQPPAPLLPYAAGVSPQANVQQSPNYKPGSDGWMMSSNGDSEFNQDLNPPTPAASPYLSQGISYPGPSATPISGINDDTYVFLKIYTGAISLKLYRYKIINSGFTLDSNGNTSDTTFLSTTVYQEGTGTMAGLGNYIYTYAQKVAGGTNMLLRITKADGTITEMTISGTAPTSGPSNHVTTDGTYLYIADDTAVNIGKYSISGTTATFVSTLTAPTNNVVGLGCNGTYLYTAESSGGNRFLRKYDLTGALQKSEFATDFTTASPIYNSWFTQNSNFQAIRLLYVDTGTTARKLYDIIPFIF